MCSVVLRDSTSCIDVLPEVPSRHASGRECEWLRNVSANNAALLRTTNRQIVFEAKVLSEAFHDRDISSVVICRVGRR